MHDLVRTILRERPSLFVGLSAQDWNLQLLIRAAFSEINVPKMSISPVLFAEGALGQPQHRVMKHIIGDAYDNDSAAYDEKATLGLFSKPLLGALYLTALRRKAEVIVSAGRGELTAKWEGFVLRALDSLEQVVSEQFDRFVAASDLMTAWREFASGVPAVVARFVRLFNRYTTPSTTLAYYPLRPEAAKELAVRLEQEEQPRLTWLMMVVAVLHEGARHGHWKLIPSTGKAPSFGQIEVEISGHQFSLFVVPDDGTGVPRLVNQNFVGPATGRKSVVIYATGRRPTSRSRVPTTALPRSAVTHDSAEIWIQEMAHRHPDADSLLDGLKYEMLCA